MFLLMICFQGQSYLKFVSFMNNYIITSTSKTARECQKSQNQTFAQTNLQFFMPLISAFRWASETAEAFISIPITCKLQSPRSQIIKKTKTRSNQLISYPIQPKFIDYYSLFTVSRSHHYINLSLFKLQCYPNKVSYVLHRVFNTKSTRRRTWYVADYYHTNTMS